MITAFLGLGGNLGDRLATLRGGRAALDRIPGLHLTAASALYETRPIGGPPGQENYLNAVLRLRTSLSPRELLHACQAVENRFGRVRGEKWGARTLDVDVLLYGDEIVREADLIIPHPQLHLRAFVLVPLSELAPDLQHPVFQQTAGHLQARLAGEPGIRLLTATW